MAALSLFGLLLVTLLGTVFLQCVSAANEKKHVLFVVADDLGRNDLGHFNNHISETPTINSLLESGIFLEQYYTFKVCSPTRTSIMSGRYAWRTGFYDMVNDEGHVLNKNYSMLPKLLKSQGYACHAIGKWNVGGIVKYSTPTLSGFDTFLGYYSACETDYFYHNASGCTDASNGVFPKDLSFNQGKMIAGKTGVNGNYSTHLYTQRAIKIVLDHATETPDDPLFIYLAYQNVHLACGDGKKKENGPVQAPCATIDRFSKVTTDTFKGQSANMLELDWGVGNVTQAYKATGMWDNTVFILVSDNGGPLDHTTNYPLRGGKHTFWEGGVRVVSFVSGPLIPQARRGTVYSGMLHSSDWYKTIVEGIVGGIIPDNTGPTPPDGYNAWQAILTDGQSPRNEVIHQVKNQYFNDSSTGYSLRVGDYKLIVGDPGDSRIIAWPSLGAAHIPFGQSGGNIEGTTGHCRAPTGSGSKDPTKHCEDNPCLFDVVNDPTESNDLSGNASLAPVMKSLMARLESAGAEGPPLSLAYPFSKEEQKDLATTICNNAAKTGFWEPADVTPASYSTRGGAVFDNFTTYNTEIWEYSDQSMGTTDGSKTWYLKNHSTVNAQLTQGEGNGLRILMSSTPCKEDETTCHGAMMAADHLESVGKNNYGDYELRMRAPYQLGNESYCNPGVYAYFTAGYVEKGKWNEMNFGFHPDRDLGGTQISCEHHDDTGGYHEHNASLGFNYREGFNTFIVRLTKDSIHWLVAHGNDEPVEVYRADATLTQLMTTRLILRTNFRHGDPGYMDDHVLEISYFKFTPASIV